MIFLRIWNGIVCIDICIYSTVRTDIGDTCETINKSIIGDAAVLGSACGSMRMRVKACVGVRVFV